jgi:hypothetical protein
MILVLAAVLILEYIVTDVLDAIRVDPEEPAGA